MVLWIALSVLAALLLVLFLVAPGRLPRGDFCALFGAHYAHRGLHSRDQSVPENSLAAFSAAAAAGYGIELDLNLTTDDAVVVFHDDTLERLCGDARLVADCSMADLESLRLAGTEQGIPLFADVLALVDGRVPLIVELKSTRRNAELCRRAYALLRDYKGPYCIESFHPGIVRWFYRHAPDIVRGQLAMGRKSYRLSALQATLLAGLLTNAAARPHFAAYRHEDARRSISLALYRLLGGKKIAWTVRDTDDIAWCRAHFDAIIFEYFHP